MKPSWKWSLLLLLAAIGGLLLRVVGCAVVSDRAIAQGVPLPLLRVPPTASNAHLIVARLVVHHVVSPALVGPSFELGGREANTHGADRTPATFFQRAHSTHDALRSLPALVLSTTSKPNKL